MARPSEYNFKLCEEICDQIREGANIKDVLKKKTKYPTFPTWCRWKREHLELFNLYIGAIQDKAENSLETIDDIIIKVKDGKLEERVARLMIDTEKWKAAKFYPKMFGTNSSLDVTTDGKAITQQVTVFKLPDNNRD